MSDSLTERELEAIRSRHTAATRGLWRSMIEGRDHHGGDSFIMIREGPSQRDMYGSLVTTASTEVGRAPLFASESWLA